MLSSLLLASLVVELAVALSSLRGVPRKRHSLLALRDHVERHATHAGTETRDQAEWPWEPLVEAVVAGGGTKTAGWFGDFSESESTFDPEGVDEDFKQSGLARAKYGKFVHGWPSIYHGQDHAAAEYAETESAGPEDAWQTFTTGSGGGLVGNAFHNSWRYSPAGIDGWSQDYKRSGLDATGRVLRELTGGGRRSPKWFDSSVNQIDGWGRRKNPGPQGVGRRLAAEGWKERAVNTTLKCAAPGCVATGQLAAFDAETEEVQNCRLSFAVHPTDFDGDLSLETVEYWKVNQKTVGTGCKPQARGCNASAERPLYACLGDFLVDDAFADGSVNGVLDLEGKISLKVDECPYQGNLLSAVAVVTCMVRDTSAGASSPDGSPYGSVPGAYVPRSIPMLGPDGKPLRGPDGSIIYGPNPDYAGKPLLGPDGKPLIGPDGLPLTSGGAGGAGGAGGGIDDETAQLADLLSGKTDVSVSGIPLQCDTPGCKAVTIVELDANLTTLLTYGGRCVLSVDVNQTDFDDGLGLPEQIDFIAVQGTNVTLNVEPGKNPCNAEYAGAPLADNLKTFSALKGYDITEKLTEVANTKTLKLAMKISEQVDECPSQGMLLDGLANIVCTPPSSR